MSRLTNCCACGCTPEQLFWVTPGPNAIASAPEGTLPTGPTGCVEVASFTYDTQDFHRLTGECQSLAVTTETDRDTVVLDVRANPVAIESGPFAVNTKAFDIQLRLWCDGNGQQHVGTVRLWAELGSRLRGDIFSPLQGTQFTQDPESFAIARTSFSGASEYWLKVYMTLSIGGQTETVQLICPTNSSGFQPISPLHDGIAIRVTATYSEGQCDVNCAYGSYPTYGESARNNQPGYSDQTGAGIDPTFSPEDPGAMGLAPAGTMIQGFPPALRHLFQTVSAIKEHKRVGATIEVNDNWRWAVGVRAKSYSPNTPPAAPAVPEQSGNECVCMPTGATAPASCFVDRTEGDTSKPADPYQYPWFLSPCSHVRRGSRVTHGMVSSQFDSLSVTLPAYEGAPYAWGNYLSQLPPGPYELNAARNGLALADNTFWLAAGSIPVIVSPDPMFVVVPGNLEVRTDSVTIAASIRTILVTPRQYGGTLQFPWTVLVPCPGDQDEWITTVTVFVYLRGRFVTRYAGSGAFPSDANSLPFAIWIRHSQSVGSELFRGAEISITAPAGCIGEFFGVNPDPWTTTTLYGLTYGTPFKVQLV